MKISKFLVSVIAAGLSVVPGLAQNEGPDLNMNPDNAALGAPMTPTEDVLFIPAEYSGFKFELPAGTIMESGSSFLAKYPDGSFGVSMTNTARPSKQKFAYELCKRNADQMRLKNPKVENVKYGKAAGAKATGLLEGQMVTILVLPYDDQEMATVILATPNRADWVDHFLSTLKK